MQAKGENVITLGIGLKCPSGVVLLTDSMTTQRQGIDGPIAEDVGSRKFLWIAQQRVALVASHGGMYAGWEDRTGLAAQSCQGDFVSSVSDAFGRLLVEATSVLNDYRAAGRPHIADEDLPGGYLALLAAGGPAGTEPRLARLTMNERAWDSRNGVQAIGGWLHTASDDIQRELRQPAPSTLAACRELAIDWARRYIRESYARHGARTLEEMLALGWVPHVAFPLSIVTITADNIEEESVTC